MNILSENIEVFPVAKPRHSASGQTNGGRLFTEYYVANIIKQLMANTGFIAGCSTSAGDAYGNFYTVTDGLSFNIEFNIEGYYFKITNLPLCGKNSIISNFNVQTVTGNAGNYYIVAQLSGYDEFSEIKGQDTKGDDGKFRYGGLDVSLRWLKKGETLPEKSLILFDLNATIEDNSLLVTDICVHKDSYQKFSPQSLYITAIDGKH